MELLESRYGGREIGWRADMSEGLKLPRGPPLRMGRTSEEPRLRMESSSASDVKLAVVAEGLEHPGSRSCGRLRVSGESIQRRTEWSGSRFGGGRNGKGADVAAGRLVREPILRKEQWVQEPISTVSQ